MITLPWIKNRIKTDHYYLSKHADIERQNDSLSISEIEEACLTGRILESYENTGRGESCLVVGFTNFGKPIHIVVGKRGGNLSINTVYVPTPPKFVSPFERGLSA